MVKQNEILLIDRDIESLRMEVRREIELVKKFFDDFNPTDIPSQVVISAQDFVGFGKSVSKNQIVADSQLRENLKELNL